MRRWGPVAPDPYHQTSPLGTIHEHEAAPARRRPRGARYPARSRIRPGAVSRPPRFHGIEGRCGAILRGSWKLETPRARASAPSSPLGGCPHPRRPLRQRPLVDYSGRCRSSARLAAAAIASRSRTTAPLLVPVYGLAFGRGVPADPRAPRAPGAAGRGGDRGGGRVSTSSPSRRRWHVLSVLRGGGRGRPHPAGATMRNRFAWDPPRVARACWGSPGAGGRRPGAPRVALRQEI